MCLQKQEYKKRVESVCAPEKETSLRIHTTGRRIKTSNDEKSE